MHTTAKTPPPGHRDEIPNDRLRRALLAALLLGGAAPGMVAADDASADSAGDPAFSLSFGVEAAIGGFAANGANFGAGRVDLRDGEISADPVWGEGYVKPSIDAEYRVDGAGLAYAGLSAVAAATVGDGDPSGSTRGGDGSVDLETAFLGWRSGGLLGATLGEDALDLSYGRQEFQVGDGFLILDGNSEQADDGAYWLAPRRAFQQAGLIRVNTHPLRADLFYLKADPDQDDTELAGLNLEYIDAELGTFALMVFRVVDSGTPENAGARDGMDVASLRVNELRLAALPDLSLWGEYVSERGGGRDGDFDASGWYLEAQYSLSALPWSPTLGYRYSRFSGDSDPGDDLRRDFEPFFYGWSRGLGTWIQGEVVGEYLLFNSNQATHMLQLSARPSESVEVGVLGFRFSLEEKNYDGTPVSDRHFADELNLYLDWQINERLTLSAAYGIAFPGDAAKEIFGDKDFQLVEVSLSLSI
ncbi:MAG: alginate export family protein [Chromatiaceae bacterium]|jgi:hypothetical protein|nr:alginate export family protein [Chromatiaceae bacterium]